ADHFVRGIVQDDLAAQRVARTAETPMPEPIADDRHPHALIVFLLCENASEQRLCAKDGPEIAGNSAARQFFGVAVTRECDLPWVRSRDIREDRVAASPLAPLGGRRKKLRGTCPARLVPNHDEPAGIRIR